MTKTNKQTNKQTNKLREFFSKKNLVYLIIPLAFAISCKKYPGGVPGELLIENKFTSKAEVKTYINEKLDKYAKVISSLSKSGLVRQVVNEQVAKKFDGDYNVLIKDLYPAIINKLNRGIKIAKIGKAKTMVGGPTPEEVPIDTFDPPSSVDLSTLEQLLTEPMIVNADTLHPQIYIPFFDLAEDDYDPCLNDPFNGSGAFPYPVVVPYDGDETTGIDIFDGYSYDANGTMVLHSNISECFAKMHTVWAVTINENGEEGFISNNISQPSFGTPITYNTHVGYIENMTVKLNKESWIKGASEIFITWRLSYINGIDPVSNTFKASTFAMLRHHSEGVATLPYTTEINRLSLGKFTRNEVNKKKSLALNRNYFVTGTPSVFLPEEYSWDYMKDWYPTKGTHLYYVIFEYDSWTEDIYNVPLASTNNSNGHTSMPVVYWSKNSPYISGIIRVSPVPETNSIAADCTNRYFADNSQIKFNTLRRY